MIAVRSIRPPRYVVAMFVACLLWGTPLLVFSRIVSASTIDNRGPFTITASTFTVSNLRIDQTIIQQGGSLADALTMDVVATNLVISKLVFLPGTHPTTFSTASTGNEPARLYGLRAHIVSIASDQGNFSSLSDILSGKLQRSATPDDQSNTVARTPGNNSLDAQNVDNGSRQSADTHQGWYQQIQNTEQNSQPTVIATPELATTVATAAAPTSTVTVQPTLTVIATPIEGVTGQANATTTPIGSQSGGNTPPGGSAAGIPGLPGNLGALSLTLTDVRIQATFLAVQAATLPNVTISIR